MDIYENIRENIVNGEAEEVINLVNKAISLKYPPESILKKGLIGGIDIVAEKFKVESVLIPEALMASRALNAGVETLEPYLQKNKRYRAKVVIGTVEGDFHDIGKNIIKTLISSIEIDVVDIGIDVSREDFIRAIKEQKPDIVMISALLTTTIKQMKYIIDDMKKEGIRDDIVVFVGGMPVTQDYANEIGADYYTENAIELRDFLNKNLYKIKKVR